MVQAAIILSSFNSGEWSDDLDGRIDNDYYSSSCSYLENLLPRIQGGLVKRPGLRFVRRTKYRDKVVKLIRFQFNTQQTYILEFGDLYMRVFKDHGAVTESNKNITDITSANPAVVTSTAHGYLDGDEVFISGVVGMTDVNGRWFKVANKTTDTFELQDLDGNNVDSTSYTAYSSAGHVAKMYELATTWTESDLPNLRWTQSADVMFFACSGKKPRTLTRSGHTTWTLADYAFEEGPYSTLNITSTTITPAAKTGSGIVLTASAALFSATDVGRWVRIRHASTWGAAKITAYTDSTHVTADILKEYPFGDTTASDLWRLGFWTNTTYPQCVEFFQGRLFWFTGEQIDGSYSGSYYTFSPTDKDGTVNNSHAIQRSLGARDVNEVIWATDNEKALVIGTRDGEWVLRANTLGDALSQTNCNAVRSTDFGAKSIGAVRVQNNALFVQRTGRMLCQTGFDLNVDGFNTVDLNLFNTRINEDGIKDFAHVAHPDNHVFCVLESGAMSAITYNTAQSVRGWARVRTKLGWFEATATGSAPDLTREEAWFVVKRKIGNQYYKYVEYMEDFMRHNTLQEDGFFLDSGLTYDGRRYPNAEINITGSKPYTITASAAVFDVSDVGKMIRSREGMAIISSYISPTVVEVASYIRSFDESFYVSEDWWICETVTSVSGLEHLEGRTVSVVGDGAELVDTVVTNGKVTLSDAACVVHIGLPYKSKFKSSRPNAGSIDGTAQGKIKRVDNMVLRLWRSIGGQYGAESSAFLDDITYRKPDDPMDIQIPLMTGDTSRLEVPGDYDLGGRIIIEHNEPLPFMLIAIVMFLVTQDGK